MKLAVIVVVAAGATAHADVDLRVKHAPLPRTLRMRPVKVAQQPAPVGQQPTKPATIAPTVLPIAAASDDNTVRDIKQPVSFTLNIGYQVEATQPTATPSLGGQPAVVDGNASFTRLRSYGFGEGFLATRGVGIAPLSTYFALRFQASRKLEQVTDPLAGTVDRPPPIATWFERSGAELRTGWAELKDFLPERYGIRGVRIRAGDMFVYGPWIMHMDGLLAAWEAKLVKFQAYVGQRHSDYTRDLTSDRASIFGASARMDLRDLSQPVPIALGVEALNVGEDLSADTHGSKNLQVEVDWRPKTDFALIGKVRRLDGETVNERLEFRGRYKQVSNLVFDLVHRHRTDWQWDPTLGRMSPDDDPLTARRYLDLGPVLPQLVASLRGGTLIAENLDVYLRGAYARDLSDETDHPSSFNASYVEGAAALQVRLRRTLAFDASVLTRQNALADPTKIADIHAAIPGDDPANCGMSTVGSGPVACQMLPAAATIGERGFTELGVAVRMSLGARRFSAAAEIYGRKTTYAMLYEDEDPEHESDVRGGGRFTIDAWVADRIRLYAAYELSSRFELAPEITGYKSLRLILAGTY